MVTQYALKPKTEFWREDFSRIGGTDRRHIVSEYNSAFEHIHRCIVFKAQRSKQRCGQTSFFELISREQALIPEIVDSQHGAHSLYIPPISIYGIQIDRAQSCLPIMQMEDMGIPSACGSEMGDHLNRRAAEE